MTIVGAAVTAFAAEKTVTGLSTGTISGPDVPESKDSPWSGYYVYYGSFNGETVKYRVLDPAATEFGGNTMFLDCDRVLEKRRYNEGQSNVNNIWPESLLRTYLNGPFLAGNFTDAEQDAIALSNVESRDFKDFVGVPAFDKDDPDDTYSSCFSGYSALADDKIFLLDAEDVLNTAYGYFNDSGWACLGDASSWDLDHDVKNHIKINGETEGTWWLRTSHRSDHRVAGMLRDDGELDLETKTKSNTVGVSPALNVSLNSIIFSSEISSEQKSYKLTLSDNELGIKVTDGKKVSRSGNDITVPYTITKGHALSANRVSLLIIDKKYVPGEVLTSGFSYLKLTDLDGTKTSGTGTFTLPENYRSLTWGSDYFVYILAEDVNGEKESDYASVPVEIEKALNSISRNVIFKVVNGSWNDGGSEERKVVLPGCEGDTLMLSSGDIPAAGNKPAEGYEAGSWNTEPKADTAVTKDVTYTYTYSKKSEGETDPEDEPDPGGQDKPGGKDKPGGQDDPVDPPSPMPAPAKKTLRELAIEAYNNGLMALGDTIFLSKGGKKYILDTDKDCQITVSKGNKFFIKDIEGKAEGDYKKKLLYISKKGKASAKKPADDLHFSFNRKDTEKKIAVSINIIKPEIGDTKKLKVKTKAGEAFDFSTTIPLNAEFTKVKNKNVAENLIYSGVDAIGEDGKLHIKGTALKKGKITISFKVYGKKYKAVIKVSR